VHDDQRVTPRRAAVAAALIAVLAVVAAVAALGTHNPNTVVTGASGATGRGQIASVDTSVPAPELVGVHDFDNTPPVTLKALRGRVVLVDFWTYTCINCRRTFPFLRALSATYAGSGLTVLGVHSPESGSRRTTPTWRAPSSSSG